MHAGCTRAASTGLALDSRRLRQVALALELYAHSLAERVPSWALKRDHVAMAKRKQGEAEKSIRSFQESIPLLRAQVVEADAGAAAKLELAAIDPAAIDIDAPDAVRAASVGGWSLLPDDELQRLQQQHTTRVIEESSKHRGSALLESALGDTHDIEPDDLAEMARITLEDVTLEQVGGPPLHADCPLMAC